MSRVGVFLLSSLGTSRRELGWATAAAHRAPHTEQKHPEELIHALLDMTACKAAIKAGDPLTPDEIDAMVARKQLVERPGHCQHVRPTTLRRTKPDLERQLKRT